MSISYTHDDSRGPHHVLPPTSTVTITWSTEGQPTQIKFTIKKRNDGQKEQTFSASGASAPYSFSGTIPDDGDFSGEFTPGRNSSISGWIRRDHAKGGPGSGEEDTGTFSGTHG